MTPLERHITSFANQATDDLCDSDLIHAEQWERVEGVIADMLRDFVRCYEQMREDGLLGDGK